jgi:pentose-5-phosphate-3-epimerase
MRHVKTMRTMADELLGTRGAFILDEQLNVLGRVPVKELESTLQEIDGVYAIVMDGEVTQGLAKIADSNGIKYIVAQSALARPLKTRIITASDSA